MVAITDEDGYAGTKHCWVDTTLKGDFFLEKYIFSVAHPPMSTPKKQGGHWDGQCPSIQCSSGVPGRILNKKRPQMSFAITKMSKFSRAGKFDMGLQSRKQRMKLCMISRSWLIESKYIRRQTKVQVTSTMYLWSSHSLGTFWRNYKLCTDEKDYQFQIHHYPSTFIHKQPEPLGGAYPFAVFCMRIQ